MNKLSMKQVQTRITALNQEVHLLTEQENDIRKVKLLKIKAIDSLRRKMEATAKDFKLTLSEHAIIRYYERVCGVNFDDLQKHILTPEVCKAIESLGGKCRIPVEKSKDEKYILIVDNYVVTTII